MLKGLLLAGVASVAVAGSAVAQSPFELGVTAGAAFSTLTGDGFNDDLGRRMSPFFGVTALYQTSGILGIETGLHYVSKGASEDGDDEDGALRIRYLEVPLLARVAIELSGSNIRPVIFAGGALAFNVGCEVEEDGDSLDCENDEIGMPVKSVDFGITGGAGADIPMGGIIFTPWVRYTAGLTNIPDIEGADLDVKNSTIQIGLTGRIRL